MIEKLIKTRKLENLQLNIFEFTVDAIWWNLQHSLQIDHAEFNYLGAVVQYGVYTVSII